MNASFRIVVILSALWMAGCDTVSSPVPLGQDAVVIVPDEWNGRWLNAEGSLKISVVDASTGRVHIEMTEEGETETLNLQLREASGWLFANVAEADFNESQGLDEESQDGDPDSPDTKSYLWARVVIEGNTIFAWRPSAEKFAQLVEDGLLPGRVEDDSVVLGALTPEHYRILTSGEHGVLLDWERPMVLYRTTSETPSQE